MAVHLPSHDREDVMVSAVRRRMQEGVGLMRQLLDTINARVAVEFAVISQAPAIRTHAADLAAGIVVPEATGIDQIQTQVRAAIVSLNIDVLTVDTATVDDIRNHLTRGILQTQVGGIALLHLVDAVLAGVEQGLRDVIRSHEARKTESASSSRLVANPAPEEPKSRAPPAPPPNHIGHAPQASARARGTSRPMPMDTPDI